jgi:hypothetical protein
MFFLTKIRPVLKNFPAKERIGFVYQNRFSVETHFVGSAFKYQILRLFQKLKPNFCFSFPSLSLVDFSNVLSTLDAEKIRRNEHVIGGFWNNFRITASFQNNFQSHVRLSESRKNFFEGGFGKHF